MIRNIQKLFNITATLVIGSLILWNCESDADQLGSQFFQNGAQGTETSYPLIAFTVNNGDSIRTDAARIQTATLGAFSELQFGLQKSSYITQVRLSQYAPDFGTNPVLDSAVLVIKPLYASDSVTTTTDEDYIYPDGEIAAKKVISTYPVKKYGKTKINDKTIFNIKVHEVTDFLGGASDKVFSDKIVATGALLGSKIFDGNISSVKITKDVDNSTLFERETSLRIPLDNTFFQTKIIGKGSTAPELSDVASFIRYFRGVKFSVEEEDGYIFFFDPTSVTITLYYKNDKVDGETTTREKQEFALNLGTGNMHFNSIFNGRSGTPSEEAMAVRDTIVGSPKIYAQGMGGPGIGLKVPNETIASIKERYKNEKIGIISARLRIFTDVETWNNKYEKPSYFVVSRKDLKTYLEDMTVLAYTGVYNLVKAFDLDKNPAYYDIGITQTFKNIIEKEAQSRQYIINVGNYTVDANGNLIGLQYPTFSQNFNTRAYTPNRAVFVGTDPNNQKSAKLILTYGKK
jgi:hypothetical protein